MSEEDALKAYFKEEFSRIDRRLFQIEKDVSHLTKGLETFTQVVAEASAKSSKSFQNALKKFHDAIDAYKKETKIEAKLIKKLTERFANGIAEWSKALEKWDKNMTKYNKILGEYIDVLRKELEEQEQKKDVESNHQKYHFEGSRGLARAS